MANGQLVALGGRRIGKPYARTNSFCQEGKNLSLKMATSPQKALASETRRSCISCGR